VYSWSPQSLYKIILSFPHYIQDDSGGKVISLGGGTIGHFEKKSSYENVSYSE
jgi:hypothetical protein